MLAAKDFVTLVACERIRREIPKSMLGHSEPTLEDCELFFDRLRQFKIEQGVPFAEIDKTRDQIVRSCQEKAKIGTIECFLTAQNYDMARRCP